MMVRWVESWLTKCTEPAEAMVASAVAAKMVEKNCILKDCGSDRYFGECSVKLVDYTELLLSKSNGSMIVRAVETGGWFEDGRFGCRRDKVGKRL